MYEPHTFSDEVNAAIDSHPSRGCIPAIFSNRNKTLSESELDRWHLMVSQLESIATVNGMSAGMDNSTESRRLCEDSESSLQLKMMQLYRLLCIGASLADDHDVPPTCQTYHHPPSLIHRFTYAGLRGAFDSCDRRDIPDVLIGLIAEYGRIDHLPMLPLGHDAVVHLMTMPVVSPAAATVDRSWTDTVTLPSILSSGASEASLSVLSPCAICDKISDPGPAVSSLVPWSMLRTPSGHLILPWRLYEEPSAHDQYHTAEQEFETFRIAHTNTFQYPSIMHAMSEPMRHRMETSIAASNQLRFDVHENYNNFKCRFEEGARCPNMIWVNRS